MHFCKMKPIFALIGCGRIAERHAKQIARTGILKAVADIVFEKGNFYLSLSDIDSNLNLDKESYLDEAAASKLSL